MRVLIINHILFLSPAFWTSSLNRQALCIPDGSLVQEGAPISQTEDQTGFFPNTSESGRSRSSALSFINPVFDQRPAGNTSVTAEDPTAANGKSRPPPPPRPPPPRLLVRRPSPPCPRTMPLNIGFNRLSQRSKSKGSKQSKQLPPRPPQAPDIDSYRCTIALDDETISRALSRANLPHSPLNQTNNNILQQWTGPEEKGRSSSGRSLSTSSSDSLDSPPNPLPSSLSPSAAPGLSTDGSSDEYDDEEDYGVGLEKDLHLRLRASRKSKKILAVELAGARPRSFVILPQALRGRFRKVRGVLNVLATPERRILLRIIELAQDKGSYFGCLVQDYVSFVQENKNCHSSSQDLLQTLRQFMTQMKAYLIQSSEINPPIESYIPEDQIGKTNPIVFT